MMKNFVVSRCNLFSVPLVILFGLGLPVVVTLYFYISYAGNAWFWMDDFAFLQHYAWKMHWNQLLDFTNFGRFFSRNIYWYLGFKYFLYNASFFYIFNFCVILGSSFLLYRIFESNGIFGGFIAGLFYPMLPSVLENYAWISNSQHILGHFFVFLFVYCFKKEYSEEGLCGGFVYALQLAVILILGFLSNVFVSMVLSLPVWIILVDKRCRKLNSTYFVLLFGILLFGLFFIKLSKYQTGPYLTSYTIETFANNLKFYFGKISFGVAWLGLIVLGTGYAFSLKKYFTSWLFIASAAFFLPIAFFVHQKHLNYAALVYLFFLLGVWTLLIESKLSQFPNLLKYIGTVIVVLIFCKSLQPTIRYLSEDPHGAKQKQQVEFLRDFDLKNPGNMYYCFRTDEKVENKTGVKIWDIPRDWWFVQFGNAYNIFVNSRKTYRLIQDAEKCDVIFIYQDGRLRQVNR